MNVVDINANKQPVVYVVRIAQHWNGHLEFFVEDLRDDPRSKQSVAWALRQMANALDADADPQHAGKDAERLAIITATRKHVVEVVRAFGEKACADWIDNWYKPERIAEDIAKEQSK